ncbi:ammonium transporter [Clavulina sp. PMI_390]|nr:ammonium transporter [Clavulina sp. PMI_390]
MSNTSYTPPGNAPWLDEGANAWQLTAASLVAFQSVPGLVVLYAGIMKGKWAINSAFMVRKTGIDCLALYAFAATLICWVIWAYKMGFGDQWIPLAGVPGPILSMDDLLKQAALPTAGFYPNFPMSTMVYFQFVFAAITLVIMAGAFLGRMNFTAWMVFVPLWLTLSYTVGAFSIWAGGFLFKLGVIDYSGGYVIHLSSGTAGFFGAMVIGPRLDIDREDKRPNNTLFVMVGAGMLWIGWNGFNGGDPYAASADAGAAVLNTNICTAMSLLTWTVLDVLFYKKPSIIGAVQGMITGLVAITPAAGVIAGWGAIVMGVLSGSVPWATMNLLQPRVVFLQWVDDTLGIFHTHMIAGFLGGFMTGILATVEGCAAFGLTNPGGAIEGNGRQVWVQIVGALFVIGWNMAITPLILLFIKFVLRIPLRFDESTLKIGDDAIHGEGAYVFDSMPLLHGHHDRHVDPLPAEEEGKDTYTPPSAVRAQVV